MSRRRRPRFAKESARLGREVDHLRGRHKKSDSAEVRDWESQHLIPARPAWMDKATYKKLASLRSDL